MFKAMLRALSPEQRATLLAEATEAGAQLQAKIELYTRARDYQVGYSVILATALDEIQAGEHAEANIIDLAGVRREMAQS